MAIFWWVISTPAKWCFVFNSQGQFRHRLGSIGSGPGEHHQLLDFAVLENGQVVLLCPLKLIFFNEAGKFEREMDLDFIPHGAVVAGETLFIRGTSSYLRKLKHAVIALDPGSNSMESFHPYDPLVDQQFLKPWNAQTRFGQELVVSECYDYRLSFYNLKGQWLRQIDFPADNSVTKNLFRQKQRADDWGHQLAMAVHRPQFIYGFGDGILIRETHHRQKLDRLALYDPGNNHLYRYPSLMDPDPVWSPLLHQIVGAAEKSIIGVCDFADLEKFEKAFPSGSGLTAIPSDNPVVLFFNIDMTANAKAQNPVPNQARLP